MRASRQRSPWTPWIVGFVVLALAYSGVREVLEFVGLVDEPGEAFAEACKKRGGHVTQKDVTCEIEYGGKSYEVALSNLDNDLWEEKAAENQTYCKAEQQRELVDARYFAKTEFKDQTVTRYVYHQDTGVCEEQPNAITVPGATPPPRKPKPKTRPLAATNDCEPGYSPCVPPYPPDLDCADVAGSVVVTGSDPHGLDADDDGVGCE